KMSVTPTLRYVHLLDRHTWPAYACLVGRAVGPSGEAPRPARPLIKPSPGQRRACQGRRSIFMETVKPNHIEVLVVTTSGTYPATGTDQVPVHQPVSVQLAK